MDDRTGRGADDETFLAVEPERHVVRRVVVDLDHVIDHRAIEDRGLLRLGERLEAREPVALLRLDPDDSHVGVALLEEAADARDRASGPETGDEGVDPTFGLPPDLGPGSLVVGLDVVRVLVLISHHVSGPGVRADQRTGQGDGAILGMIHRAQVVGCLPHLCAEHPHHDLLLIGHAVGNRDRDAEPESCRQCAQGDPGVARRGLDQPGVIQLTSFEKPAEQICSRAVLHRAERVHPLELE